MAAAHTAPPPGTDCPVCSAQLCALLIDLTGSRHRPEGRYYRCDRCKATFLATAFHPSRHDELAHYRNHRNDIADPRYRAFLGRLTTPLMVRLQPGLSGLDYGCGPAQALADIMAGAGFAMNCYDPFFAPDPVLLEQTYDFITCSETAEHFHRPSGEFERLRNMLRPGGLLALMTCFQTNDEKFADWHYRRDPTHVVFYREQTFCTLAADWGWHCEIPANDIALLRKPGRAGDAA